MFFVAVDSGKMSFLYGGSMLVEYGHLPHYLSKDAFGIPEQVVIFWTLIGVPSFFLVMVVKLRFPG